MRQYFTYDETKPEKFIFTIMILFASSLVVFGFFCDTPQGILAGLITIIQSQAGLITDSMEVGGMGAAFVNAGMVMFLSIALLKVGKLSFTGISIACLLLMAGFSLFGKDICNITPIIGGGWLYALYKKEHFGKYLYISLFGTALAPVVTELPVTTGMVGIHGVLLSVGTGVLIGFLLPAIAAYTMQVHQGYNLYNVGFTAGLVGMVIVSILKFLGYSFVERLVWSSGNNLKLSILLFIQFAAMIIIGYFCNHRSFKYVLNITRHSGRAVADFVMLDGFAVTLINMGVIGTAATWYVLTVGGDLNGPTLGGIYTICGFGAFGKHIRNISPVVLGVVIISLFSARQLNQPSMMLAALFSTALAPIAGQYGWWWGSVAGAIHVSVVLNTGMLHAGLNLYNNGFAAGLVCVVLVPLIEALKKD
ncbi:DUF1576 domain-containing protein [Oscillospiraceae bacterium PP1C4]